MRYKQHEPPPPRNGASRDKRWRKPRTGTSGAEQAAGATGRGTSRRSRRHPELKHPGTGGGGRTGLEHPGSSKQQEQRGEEQAGGAAATPDWSIQGQEAADSPDWNIRGEASSRSNRERNNQEEAPPPRTGASWDKWRKTPWIGRSGAKQEGEATTPGTRRAGEKGPAVQGTMVRGGSSRRSPRRLNWSGSNTKDHAREER